MIEYDCGCVWIYLGVSGEYQPQLCKYHKEKEEEEWEKKREQLRQIS